MATNLGLVTHATQGHAHVLAPGCLGDRLAQRGFTHARRAHQAQNRGLQLVHTLLHSEVFQNTVFDLIEAVVVFIEHVFGDHQVFLDLGFLAPGQVGQGLDVVAHHRCLSRHGRHQLELLELCLGLFARLLRHLGQLDFLFQLFQICAVFALAQFFLDGLDLLIQIKVALALFHLLFDAATDLLVDIQNIDFALQLVVQIFQPVLHLLQLQHGLLVL